MRRLVLGLALLLPEAVFTSGLPGPVIPLPTIGGQCVEDTDFMRREHMELLLHQRDETVHRGVRNTRHSLTGCIGCHARRDTQGRFVRVDAPGQFCATCHQFAAVSMDCFECHAAVPDVQAMGTGAQRAFPGGPLPATTAAAGADTQPRP